MPKKRTCDCPRCKLCGEHIVAKVLAGKAPDGVPLDKIEIQHCEKCGAVAIVDGVATQLTPKSMTKMHETLGVTTEQAIWMAFAIGLTCREFRNNELQMVIVTGPPKEAIPLGPITPEKAN